MITSIRIKKGGIESDPIIGSIRLDSGPYMQIKESKGSVHIGTTELDDIENGIPTACPYVTTISGTSPDGFGNVFVLGGSTSQVDYNDKGILLCDMSQRNDSPSIFRAIYDMLRILRRWLDAHKDSLLLSEVPGESQWKHMQDSDMANDYYLTAKDKPEFSLPIAPDIIRDARPRGDIVSIGPALRLYNEYQSVVAMWNRIVKDPESIVEIRIHPGDNAGIYVGVTSNIPLQEANDNSKVVITTTITVSFTGQTGDNLYVWSRAMDAYCRVYPRRAGDREYSITFPGEYKSGSSVASNSSVLDRDGKVVKYPHTLVATYTESLDGSKSPLATTYTSQMLYEAIPFCKCAREVSYADSLSGLHYVQQDINTWTIHVLVEYYIDDIKQDTVIDKSYTKKTIYAKVCTDPYKDKLPEEEPEQGIDDA